MDALISNNALVFYLLTLVGIFAHACKKWIWREIDYSVWAYLFKVDIHATLATVVTALGATGAMIGKGVAVNYHDTAQALLVITTAFSIDASVLPATAGKKAGKEADDGTSAKP